ncbi:hypothetical protein [Helicobacter pylori]|uniref:hypothetical protein n=1 Tax=Helicobacter pylori TaxID=210 RepID=UPI0004D7B335|nr:hypothetical protein [Helicobacter pylori]KEY39602.1 hypothetical protein GZ76_02415 [Helicobacter pylori]MCQ2697316.1 hypothetical protein [Helicobacter pylori]NHA51487.1 hypothetical protein [Helicobacter pylori]NHA99537.1 hypothetical protein [Helicobacter pylori]OOQ13751.1 hypothetical protein B0X47_05195 [Helicobacter pylori]
MGFQNENKLKVGALVKATINNKVVETKVINIGFNRVTLRSQKGNEATYAFNSEKFLKWFNKVPLTEHMRLHAENKKADILDGVKVVTSGPSVKDRTSTPKEPKESKFKLDFDFDDKTTSPFAIMMELYANEKRSKRLGLLIAPMSYEGRGFQFSLIVIHALSFMVELKHHSDHEFNAMIENRNVEECYYDTFDDMLMGDVFTFCRAIEIYAKNLKRDNGKVGVTLEDWAKFLPKNQKEAKFIAQFLCDGGINKYDLTCAGLTPNLLADNLGGYGLRDEGDEDLDKAEAETENLEN